MRSRITALVLALVLCVSLFTPALALEYGEEYRGYQQQNVQQYSDVPTDHWAYQSIATCSQRDWFNGYPDGSFRPDNKISRNEAAKVFAVALGLTLEDDPTPSFTDTANDWAKAYIEATKVLFPNPANLQSTKNFRPTQTITREETIYALVVAWRYASKVKNADLSLLNMFKDTNSISVGVKPYVAVGVSEGLLAGYPDSTIRAQDGLTRAEFATLLARALTHGYGPDDTSEPKITLDRYSDKTTAEQVTITGKVSPMVSGTTLKLDDDSVKLGSNGSFSVTLQLEEGVNKYTLTSCNIYGVQSTREISIERVAEDPYFDFYNTIPTSTEDEELTLLGQIVNYRSDYKLTLNGKAQTLGAEGFFNLPLPLSVGVNDFTLSVTSRGDNNRETILASETISVTRTYAPVEIMLPDIPASTGDPGWSITGMVWNFTDDCTLYLDGSKVSVDSDSAFTINVLFKEGLNSFTLEVKRGGAVVASETISVTRTYAPVEIMLPDIPASTEDPGWSITGMVWNFTDDCTLYLDGSKVSVDSDSAFTIDISLKEGSNSFTLEVKRGGAVVASETISTIRVVAGVGEWVASLPAGVTSDLYNIETKTQYRYRDNKKETTTETSGSASAPTKSGWTYSDSSWVWGTEKDNGYSSVSSSDTRKVRTVSDLKKSGYTQYQYYGYRRTTRTSEGKRAWHYCLSAGKNVYGGSFELISTDWLNSPLSYDKKSGSHTAHSGCDAPTGTAYRYTWNNDYYYWEKTRYIDPEYQTHYYYSDKVFTHNYYRWVEGSWSSWTDTSYTSSDSRDVETRTVYRYNLK